MKKATEKMSAVETAYNKMFESNMKALKDIETAMKEHKKKALKQIVNYGHVGDLKHIDEKLADILTHLL